MASVLSNGIVSALASVENIPWLFPHSNTQERESDCYFFLVPNLMLLSTIKWPPVGCVLIHGPIRDGCGRLPWYKTRLPGAPLSLLWRMRADRYSNCQRN